VIELRFERVVMFVAVARARRRGRGKEMSDVVTIDGERVPFDKCIGGVDERRHRIVVEKQSVAAKHFQIHLWSSTPSTETLEFVFGYLGRWRDAVTG
jgi:hypothetical protein